MIRCLTSIVAPLLFAGFVASCGATNGGDGNGECSSSCVGDGSIQRASTKTIGIDLENLSKETQYLIAPFILGKFDEINGRSSTERRKRISASVLKTSAGQEVDQASQSAFAAKMEISSFDGYSHSLRSFWNRFNPRIEDSRSQSVRDELELLEAAYNRLRTEDSPAKFLQSVRSVESKLRLSDGRRRASQSACPEEIFVPNSEEPLDSNLLTFKEQGQGDFCLVLVKDGSLVSEKDPGLISESIASALATYKLIYKSNFDFTRGEYSFRPLVIVVPMDDAEIWPQDPALQLAGAFVAAATEEHNRPTIYVPADMTKLGIAAEKAKEAFHAAIAHELQHAIVNYHRVWRPSQPLSEIPSIDEGLAHFMEDLLGYGELNFGSFANTFLASTAIDPDVILQDATVTVVNESARGAAQSLTYYLVSQMGGVSFSGGSVDTDNSPGLKFIRDFVEGDAVGIKGLTTVLNSDWQDLFGGFLGALYIDNAVGFSPHAKFSVQPPIEGISDTTGKTGKKFGMRFNAFAELPTVEERLKQISVLSSTKTDLDIYNYQTKPILVKVDAVSPQKVEIATEAELVNFAATVIRVK